MLDAVAAWQRDFEARRGSAFVHAADEFYLLAGEEPPAGDAPEQYENGVGICAALLAEAGELAAAWAAARRARTRRRTTCRRGRDAT